MRSTRQGCARGQKHGTLDQWSQDYQDLGSPTPWARTSHSAMNARVARGEAPDERSRRLQRESGSLGGGGGCWCGDPWGHDWPGKDDGAPHPR